VAGAGQADEIYYKACCLCRRAFMWIERLQGFAGKFRKALMNGSVRTTWNSNSGVPEKSAALTVRLKRAAESGPRNGKRMNSSATDQAIHEPQFCTRAKQNAEAEIFAVRLERGSAPQFPASRRNIIRSDSRKFCERQKREPRLASQNSRLQL